MLGENDSAALPRIVAVFHPQAWVNKYAVEADAEGDLEWDATADVLAFDVSEINGIKDDEHDSDGLRGSASAPRWVRDWGGPFYVEVESAVRDFLDAHGVDGALTAEKLAELRSTYAEDISRAEAAEAALLARPGGAAAEGADGEILEEAASLLSDMAFRLAGAGLGDGALMARAVALGARCDALKEA